MLANIVGIQTPRVSLMPFCTSNGAQEAIELAENYGLNLDEWQQNILSGWLAESGGGKWASPRCGLSVPRQNGKGSSIEARELYGLVVLGERILHTAQELKTSKDHYRRLMQFFEQEDLKRLVKKFVNTNGEEAIWMHNGGVIRFIARSKNSARGFTADLLVCDEAQDMDEDKFAALLPTLATADNPQTILIGTPPAPNMAGEVFGRFHDTGLEGKDPRLCWMEWSAPRDADLDDIEVWAQANPAMGIRLTAEKIADERASMDDETFARERLGMWAGIASQSVIDMELWQTLGTDLQPQNPVAFAIDVSPNRDMASIGVAGYIGDAIYYFVIENRKGTGWITKRLKELCEKWEPVAVVVDQGSPAATLLPEFNAARIRILQTSTSDVANACGQFYDRVMNERALHADQPALNTALAVAGKRPIRDAWAWNRKNPNADITPLVAVTLAGHGLTQKRKPREQQNEAPKRRLMTL